MRRFTQLFRELDEASDQGGKAGALARYFREVPPGADRDWAIRLLEGERLKLGISSRKLLAWAQESVRHPPWLVEACRTRVGDLAETAALLMPLDGGPGTAMPLHKVVEEVLLPLQHWDERFQIQMLRPFWESLNRDQALLLCILLTRGLRPGLEAGTVEGVLAGNRTEQPQLLRYTATLVLVYARMGAGRIASGGSRYTLAARSGEDYIAVASVEKGLSQQESREIDRWITENAISRRGPVTTVPQWIVMQIAFAEVVHSVRRKSGLLIRHPRILSWCREADAREIDTVEDLRSLLETQAPLT
jgi:hypothetical protein